MVMGLLGAIGSSVAGGIQERQAQQQAVDLARLEYQLDMELAKTKREWAKEDASEARDLERARMEEIQAGLPAGVYATPSDVRISDTRLKKTGSGNRKLDPVVKERISYLKMVMEDAKEDARDETASPEQQAAAMREYQEARNEYRQMLGYSSNPSANGGASQGFDINALLNKHGVEKKKEQPKRAAPEPQTARVQDPGMSQRVGEFLQNRPPVQARENTFRERLMQSGIAER
jgi:hypothetical protein